MSFLCLTARAGLTLSIALAAPSCAIRDAFWSPPGRSPDGLSPGGCARDRDGEQVCLRARTDCPRDALDCELPLADPLGQLRGLDRSGAPMSFRVGAMVRVSRRNHFQGVQRLVGDGPARFVVTRSTAAADEADFGVVELSSRTRAARPLRRDPAGGLPVAAAPAGDRLTCAFDTGAAYTHAGGGQRVGRIFAVPLERGAAGSAVYLYDLSDPAAPRLLSVVPHRGPDGERLDEAGTASLAALADGHFLLVIGRRHANHLDVYRSTGTDLETTGWRYLDHWFERELATAIGDREFGDYQNLALLPGADGLLYMLGSHRHRSGTDWLDLYQLTLTASASAAPEVIVTKVGRKHLRCSVAGSEHCDLDAGAGAFVDRDGRLRVYAISHEAARSGDDGAADPTAASVGMMEFVSSARVGRAFHRQSAKRAD
jgi:hypothetical protein